MFLLFSSNIRQDRLRGGISIEKMDFIAGVVSKKMDSNAYVTTQAEAGRDSMHDNVTEVLTLMAFARFNQSLAKFPI